MRRLFTIGALGLALGLSSLGSGVAIPRESSQETTYFATDSYNVFGVQLPIVKRGVGNEVSGGNVEKDFMSFYNSPKTANPTTSLITADRKSDDEYISVFGVQIPRSSRL
ncbi:MAG TPA: hypothetical protein VFF49_09545 [Thermodesulfobacteriota bacterium]|nr:hypothetical protein [Thermodesulfobacteriota bacterium]